MHEHVHTCTHMCSHYAVPKDIYVSISACISRPIIKYSYPHTCMITCPHLCKTQTQQSMYTYIHICVYTHAPTHVIPSYIYTCSHVHVHRYTDPFVIHKFSCMYMHVDCYMNMCMLTCMHLYNACTHLQHIYMCIHLYQTHFCIHMYCEHALHFFVLLYEFYE